MTLRDLTLRLRALINPRRAERDLADELSFHIERETVNQIAKGVSPGEARARALARFGPVPLAADRCRDARGTAVIDGLVRDVTYAFRTFRRAPLASLTIVTTVGLGLGLVAVVFTILNTMVFRVDQVPDPHELFGVERPSLANGDRVRLTGADLESLRRDTAVFTDAFGMLADIDSRVDGRMMSGTFVTGNFFQVLGVSAALGRTLAPADDQRGSPSHVMVLSHRGWTRHFDRAPDVLNRTLVANGATFTVIGVMPEGFRGLMVGAPSDYWAPLATVRYFRPMHAGREHALMLDVIGRLRPGLSHREALAGLMVWDTSRSSGSAFDRRAANLTLTPRNGTADDVFELIVVFIPLFFAFGLILLIGCANAANLLLARGVARQREIGIRLAIGGTRRRIIRQLLTESVILALAAAVVGYGVSRLMLEATIYSIATSLAPELAETISLSAPAADWRVGLFLMVGAFGATVLFALAPALQATRLELVRTIRGEVLRDARPGRARNALIFVQVMASALLLTCSAVFLRSAFASATMDPGIRTSDTIIVEIINEALRRPMIEAIAAEPLVTQMAASWPDPLSRPRVASAESAGEKIEVAYKFVSPEFFAVLDIPILRGRGFAQDERDSNTAVVVVSETIARELWPGGNAIGQVMVLTPDPASDTRRVDEPLLAGSSFTVIGVARHVPGFRIAGFKEANVYVPTNVAVAETTITVRVRGEPAQARRALLQRLTAIDPNMGQVITMQTLTRMETYFLQVAFWITLVLGALALALTLSGLFSVLSYLVEQRSKEIGLRIALGATTRNIGRLVVSQTARPVGLGLMAGAGFAVLLGIVLLSISAAAPVVAIVHVLDPVAYILSVVCIIGACLAAALVPALRAARIDLGTSLRQE